MFKLEKIVKRSDDFAKWYTSIINNAQLIIYGDVKGTVIFQPHGWAIWENIQNLTNNYFKQLDIKNVALPTLIPMQEFAREKKHLEGFAPEVFMVTKIGNKELEDPYVIRPTSEILFCKYFQNVTNSYKQLPLKFNQWCSVMRAEKTTRPFLRNSEFYWQELHAVFENKIDALAFTKDILQVYTKIISEDLCMPLLGGEKTVGERFAGAENTFTAECLMQDGQMLQCGTSHYLGTNFAKIYNIKFQNKTNATEFVHQMSAGISTRLIGGIIMIHSDDNGLVLPPSIAPVQIKINTVGVNKNPEIVEFANKLKKQLSNYRVVIDNEDSGLGFKLSNGEILGVPIQIIVGAETVSKNVITIIRRDDQIKQEVSLDQNILTVIDEQIQIFKTNIYQKAKKHLDDSIQMVASIEELKTVLKQNKIAKCCWAGNEQQEKEIKELTGASPRVIIENAKGTCFYTKQPSEQVVIFGRAY